MSEYTVVACAAALPVQPSHAASRTAPITRIPRRAGSGVDLFMAILGMAFEVFVSGGSRIHERQTSSHPDIPVSLHGDSVLLTAK
jgi:hypothetical protein